MDMQNVSNLQIPEGQVRTIHDKNNNLLWGRVAYDVKYAGDIFQQTYSGKNLAKVTECDISTSSYSLVISDGSVDINSITSNNWFDICGGQRTGDWVPTNVASVADYNLTSADEGTYVLSAQNFSYINTANQNAQVHVVTNQRRIGTSITRGATSFEPKVFTLEAGEHVKMIGVWIGATGSAELKGKFQLEVGSQPSSYEPYTGEIPAPNPSYPTPINVVTGMQTITITDGTNNQNFIVDLGSTELCKIDDYQDYIHKSGNDWYVHKACGKQTVDTSNIALRDTYTNVEYAMFSKPTDYGGYGAFGYAYPIVCTHAIHSSNPGNWDSASNIGCLYSGAETFRLWIGFAKGTGLDAIKTKLTGCINYYALGTPTDTKVTDDTLIGQLNAVHEWLARYGYDATVTGNLPIIISKTNL